MTTGMASCTRAETWSSALELTVGLRHQAAFAKHFAGEPLAGEPPGQNSAQRCVYSLYTEAVVRHGVHRIAQLGPAFVAVPP
jgi:hypothetical protein